MTNKSAGDGAAAGFAITTTLLIASSLPMMAFAPLSAALPSISIHFAHVPNVDYLSRFVLTMPAIFIALLAPFAGYLVDRLGRKRLLLGSVMLYGVAGLSGAFLDSLTALLVSRAVVGIAIGGIMTSSTTLAGDYFVGRARQRFMGLRGAFVNYAAVVINALGGLVATINWRAAFGIFVLAFVLLPVMSRILYEPDRGEGARKSEAKLSTDATPSADSTPVLFLIFVFIVAFVQATAFFMGPVQIPFYLRELGSTSPATAGLAVGTSSFAVATASLFYVWVRSRLSAEAVMVGGFVLVALGYGGVAAADGVGQVFGSVLVSGAGFGFLMANLMVWVMDQSPARIRGRVVGGVTTATFVGQFATPLVSQPIANAFSLSAAYWSAAAAMAMMAAGLVLYLLLRRGVARGVAG
jgi:MFS family permease